MDLCFLILCLFSYVLQVLSDGTLSVHFNHFTNPQGLGANGHCCDGRAIFCLSPCDHYFIICLDYPDGNRHDFVHCPIGRYVSNKIDEMDSIKFGASIGGINNPMLLPVRYWKSGFLLKIEVWDSDIGVTAGEYVDGLSKIIRLPMAKRASLAESKTVLLSTRTSLTVEVKVFCNTNYYGPQCMTKCIELDDQNGHFACDPNTGERYCLPGWSGKFCKIAINECASAPCANGGKCQDYHNDYQCECPTGTSGKNCENNLDDCLEKPCSNGGSCVDGIGEYKCFCSEGFIGERCHIHDRCVSNPCFNNGTCINVADFNFTCQCQGEYYGDNCEIGTDVVDPITSDVPNIDSGHATLAIPILVSGHLNGVDEVLLRDWLVLAVSRSIAIKLEQLSAVVSLSHCTGDDGSQVTNVFMRVKYDNHNLSPDKIQKSIDFVTKKIEKKFPFKLYDGEDCIVLVAQTAARVEEKSWLSYNWFVPVGIAVVVLVAIIVVILFYVKRRTAFSRKKSIAYAFIESSSSAATTPRNSTSSAPEYDITQAFSNAIYLQNGRGFQNGTVKLPELPEPEECSKLADDSYDCYSEEENIYHTID